MALECTHTILGKFLYAKRMCGIMRLTSHTCTIYDRVVCSPGGICSEPLTPSPAPRPNFYVWPVKIGFGHFHKGFPNTAWSRPNFYVWPLKIRFGHFHKGFLNPAWCLTDWATGVLALGAPINPSLSWGKKKKKESGDAITNPGHGSNRYFNQSLKVDLMRFVNQFVHHKTMALPQV